MLLTLSSYFKKVLISIMLVFPLALGVNSLINPYIAGLPYLAVAMIFSPLCILPSSRMVRSRASVIDVSG